MSLSVDRICSDLCTQLDQLSLTTDHDHVAEIIEVLFSASGCSQYDLWEVAEALAIRSLSESVHFPSKVAAAAS